MGPAPPPPRDRSSWQRRWSSVQPPVQVSPPAAPGRRCPPAYKALPAATRPSNSNSTGKHTTHKCWSNNRIEPTLELNLWEVSNLCEVSSNNRIEPTIESNLCEGFNRTCDDQHSNRTCGKHHLCRAKVVQSDLVLTDQEQFDYVTAKNHWPSNVNRNQVAIM